MTNSQMVVFVALEDVFPPAYIKTALFYPFYFLRMQSLKLNFRQAIHFLVLSVSALGPIGSKLVRLTNRDHPAVKGPSAGGYVLAAAALHLINLAELRCRVTIT